MQWYDTLRERTLCKIGVHCRAGRRVRKWDNGRRALLCRHCYLIAGKWNG
jgi:hypothetical protein